MDDLQVMLALLLVLAALGGFDTLVNHDRRARLAARVEVRPELWLHAAREGLYGLLFLGLAWGVWLGIWSWLPPAILLAIIAVDLRDTVVEFQVRHIDALERLTHVVNWFFVGAFATMLLRVVMLDWSVRPAAVVWTDHGWVGWMLTAAGLANVAVSLRDALAGSGLRARQEVPTGR